MKKFSLLNSLAVLLMLAAIFAVSSCDSAPPVEDQQVETVVAPKAPTTAAERARRDSVLAQILAATENGGLKGINAPAGFLLKKAADEGFDGLLRFECDRIGNLRGFHFKGSINRDTMSRDYGELTGEATWKDGAYGKFAIDPARGQFGLYTGMSSEEAGFQTYEGGHAGWDLARSRK